MCNLLTSAMETKVTSKTSSLKALLLRAWRERWSDLQWGINIKTILPRGVSGDVYNLADCILQQALVGLGPNQLVLSYLKHSLSSQLVSYAAVLQRISKYDAFHKPHCIVSLLEFLESIQVGITCRGKPEEDLLAAAVLSIVHWLLQCYLYTLTKMPQNSPLTPQPTKLMDKPASILKQMLSSDFLCAMMYLAKYDDKDLYIEVVKKCQEIEALLKTSSLKSSVPIEDSLKKLCNLEVDCLALSPEMTQMESITYCLQPLFAAQVLINPSTETSVFVNQMLMVQRLKNYTNPRLYCEIIRACLMCLHNVAPSTMEQSQWGAILFLKLPNILKELQTIHSNGDEKSEYSQDVLDAFELLLHLTPLLDKVDSACSCNSVECLLNALQKLNLVTEKQAKQLSSRREGVLASLPKLESSTPSPCIPKVMSRAEATLAGLLKTLNADYTKIHEALLGMLCQILSGKSFELMLAVANVEGKMKTFVTKLIKFNEGSKQIAEPVSQSTKNVATRAMLFEISFLMLCSIVQIYGPDVVLEEGGGGDSFFEQWVRECMPARDQPKSPQKILQNVDPARVDALLAQINSPEPDFKSSNIKWHIACQSAMGVVKELLFAWEGDMLGASDVKRALDGLRAIACCLPVCAAAWLCAYMSITHQDALLKPMNMVQHFLTPVPGDELQDYLKERSHLMSQIIRKMQCDVHPPPLSKTKAVSMSHNIISRQPVLEQLQSVWRSINQTGWISIPAIQSLESLLNTGGSLWFVTNIVREVLKYRYQVELAHAVDLAFAIFHLDIENCTLDLIQHIIPQYLYNSLQSEELVEPQSSILAKLCVYCIFSTLEYHNSNPCRGNNRKRVRRDLDAEELDALGVPANKILRLNETGDGNPIFGSQSPQAQGQTNGQKSVVLREPLMSAMNGLFTIFTFLAGRDGEVSQQTHFILQFLRLMVQCGKDRTRIVLQGMPQTLVPCLLKALPELFTTDILLRFYDVQTAAGRKATARDLCMLRNISLKPSK
ncbi:mediator of RNA polymerase II transcription subunit 24 isoform X1 [Ceratina calcarata]|uniref:Mediator of RNA polymerase II transcription subunit 24 n=1 Tax=Ceratina calcarata TaxID=156304 RepID=A0AAJ7NF23_9HYME|nr:mediator of RNA polymerase II transcription subunit 24 isoform X1 [Ceratina calcarata]XP_026675311.1 mediator of RNA polymerase II transcription subunit 24 isoform X1 [Ceratina calcarata]XP_026675312.1 mediator of RNA polymerase II transcription subunit 24 isoform X1 [Ceratina calcarata]XP_026675313.1 mediator of RNA polymerase II transcription subunit 24 isoform X1 [Ceratina calcarata]